VTRRAQVAGVVQPTVEPVATDVINFEDKTLPLPDLAQSAGGTKAVDPAFVQVRDEAESSCGGVSPARAGDPDQKRGSWACSWASSAASSGVATEGGEPSRGCWAVSFMHRTAITPTIAAAVA
jgi:hypothetical protein